MFHTPVLSHQQIAENTRHRRAVEAVIWGIPAVNYDQMLQAARKAGASPNQIIHWSRLPDWKNQTLTPNPDSIYFMPFYDTATAGPIVVEIPPADTGSITGTLMDCWQVPLEDVGPAGVDKGKGGKYLILPPGFETAPGGYIPLKSDVFQGFGLLRSLLAGRSDADVAAAVEYGKRIKLYPFSQADNPPATGLVDVSDVVLDATIPYDLEFFRSLDRVVQGQPWLARDRAMISPLASIGIAKGERFDPDPEAVATLEEAAQEALAWFVDSYETIYTPYYPGEHWFFPASKPFIDAMATSYGDPNAYPLDERGTAYYCAFSSIKHLGAGQFYLFVARDRAGEPLDGAATYRLHVPAKVPVRQYWSATLYDFDTHALIRDMAWSSRSSLSPDLATNADGSVDLFFAPSAPAGREANWVPTKAGGRFEALFRFYGPEKPLADKSWVLPDIERVS